MCASQIVKVRRVAAAGALAAMLWCGQARAQVFDQVPSDALAVLEIKSLEKLNTKVAGMAKTFGLDKLKPELKDPLGTLLEKSKMGKGIDKAGDAALAIYGPDKNGHDPEPVGLVPVSDYEAFLGNFTKAPEGSEGDITAVLDPHGSKNLFIAHRGNYAVLSDKKGHLHGKAGIKLTRHTAHEVETKDAVFLFNMPVVRTLALPALKENRAEIVAKMNRELSHEDKLKQFVPVFNTIVNEVLDGAESFLSDADAVVFSGHISDAGLSGSVLIDFAADSRLGKTVAELKPSGQPMLAGLPDRKYFIFGGASVDSKVAGRLAAEWLDPIVKELNATNTDVGKQIASALETVKIVASSSNHSSAGWIVPTKPLGQESLFQQIGVTYGDAQKLATAEKKLLTDMNDLMALLPQNAGMKTKIVFAEPKMIGGAQLQTFATKMDFDANDPRGMQAQQMLQMLYGPQGMSGNFGALNDSAFIVAQGADDEALKELIASAREGKDVLSGTAHVSAVTSHLPAHHSAVYYVALDNIVTTVVRYAQGFGLPIKLKLADNLAPIGVSVGTEDSSLRMDSFVPTETVQSLIAAGIQAYTQFQAGPNGGL